MYIPSMYRMLDDVYSTCSRGDRMRYSHATLIFALFASAISYLDAKDCVDTALEDMDLTLTTALWTNIALDAADCSRRVDTGSLEDVQATILLYFLVFNAEGFSPRSRLLHSTAIATAHEIKLHRIDQSGGPREKHAAIDAEIKRRIWWFLVSSDWVILLCAYARWIR